MERYGTVLVFKPGTTEEEAKAALEKIKDVVDLRYYAGNEVPVNSFDDYEGGPVWYVP